MDSIIEMTINFIIEVIKFIFYVVFWSHILFYIGVITLKTFTLNKYPVGMQYRKHINLISFVGLDVIYSLWSLIATHNFSENFYLLFIGLGLAILLACLIAIKYYSKDRDVEA